MAPKKTTRPEPLPQSTQGHVTAAAHLDAMVVKIRMISQEAPNLTAEDSRRMSAIADDFERAAWAFQTWVDHYSARFEDEETSKVTTRLKL